MRKRNVDIKQEIETPVLGFGVVLLSMLFLLIVLWGLIVAVRVVLG